MKWSPPSHETPPPKEMAYREAEVPRWKILVLVVVALLAAGLVVVAANRANEKDTRCTDGLYFSRVVGFELAGTADRFALVADHCAGSYTPTELAKRDGQAINRDYLLIASYVVLLGSTCLLGGLISKRGVTLKAGKPLAWLAAIAGGFDVVENLLLHGMVKHPHDVGNLRTGIVAIAASTKFVLVGTCALYGLGSLLGALALIIRSLAGRSFRPEFEPATKARPLPSEARALRLSSEDLRRATRVRFQRPDGTGADDEPAAKGVCFSGGGIRSASFTIGCLRSMQAKSKLAQLDYMSTVSGGGYAAMAWQIASRWREDTGGPAGNEPDLPPPLAKGSDEYRYVKEHARFLWPPVRKETWWSSSVAFVGTVSGILRGILFNVLLLAGLLYVVARPLGWWSATWALTPATGEALRPEHLWQIVGAVIQVSLLAFGFHAAIRQWWVRIAGPKKGQWIAIVVAVVFIAGLAWVVQVADQPFRTTGWELGGLGAGIVVALVWAKAGHPKLGQPSDARCAIAVSMALAGVSVAALGHGQQFSRAPVAGVVIAIAGLGFAGDALRKASANREPKWAFGSAGALVALAIAEAVGATGTFGVSFGWLLIAIGLVGAVLWMIRTSQKSGMVGYFLAVVAIGFAKLWLDKGFVNTARKVKRIELREIDVAVRVAIVLTTLTVAIAVARLLFSKRSLRATIVTVSISLAAALVLPAALLAASSLGWCRWLLIVIFVLAVAAIAVVTIRKAAKTDFDGPSGSSQRLVVGLLFALLLTVSICVLLWTRHWPHAGVKVSEFSRWCIIAGLVTAAYVLLDQKWWSPHQMYKRRLGAAFSPILGVDGKASMLPMRTRTRLPVWAAKTAHGPQLLVCAAAYDTTTFGVNDTQTVPYVFTADSVGSVDLGFARTVDFEAALGRANENDGTLRASAAVSGAAVSQAVGAVRMASFSQLIALLNLRLGVWLPSPSYINALRPHDDDPGFGIRWLRIRRFSYLLKELSSRYDPDDRFLYVTDGGQLENLGLYALLSRRCAEIYAFDASGDSPMHVTSLVESMKLAVARLGVGFGSMKATAPEDDTTWPNLFTGLTTQAPGRPDGWSLSPVATFRVFYPSEASEWSPGTIHFGKARLWRDLDDEDIMKYATLDPKFPGDSTIDQFLEDDQFAAYVRLGELVANEALPNTK